MDATLETGTILVVDDEPGPRESLRMILSPSHRVLTASDGAEACEILRRAPVDVVTLDLRMPGLEGGALMRSLRREFPDVELVVITGHGSVEAATQGVRCGISDFLQKPFDVVQVLVAVTRALARREARRRLAALLETADGLLGAGGGAQAVLRDLDRDPRLVSRLGVLAEAGPWSAAGPQPFPLTAQASEFLEVLAETIESQDPYMRGHARRVAFYACLLAERLGLAAEEREQVRISAFLHDLGKIGVPTDLLVRPGALEDSERAVVERHPEIGARLIGPLGVPAAIGAAIRHHHEWWNGAGYPDRLRGAQIPPIARLIHVVDAFDAMTCDRPYRRALPRDVAVRELARCAGSQFDEGLVAEFLALIEGRAGRDLESIVEAGDGAPASRQSAAPWAQA